MNYQAKLDQLLKQAEKPGRYIGGEVNSIIKDPKKVEANFCFCFPDLYEIGMSYLGMQILYSELNNEPNIYCQRAFQPQVDMEELMRKEGLPLLTLESKMPAKDCDFIGFTLQYEMSFSTILNMIDLAGLEVYAKDRKEEDPIIIAGGPCAYNPEPLADFFDLFIIGDGEKFEVALVNKYIECKKKGMTKDEFLKEACQMQGIYVPKFYETKYNEDGTIKEICKLFDKAPDRVERCLIDSLEDVQYPTKPVIPMVEAVHDRAVVETFRGCTRGCRFCQAGMIYRPVRERSKEKILELAKEQIKNTGNDELSLLSLSTSDLSCFESMVMDLIDYTKANNVAVSLPSLRVDKFAFEVLDRIQEYKKSGLTYAVEAGTQRLRDVINKGVTEDDVFNSLRQAMELGWTHVKLYFMIGLPTETYEDLDGIADMARRIKQMAYDVMGKMGGKFNVTVACSNFVPKADTPFQWMAQDSPEELEKKHNYLAEKLRIKGVTFNYHDNVTSSYEAIFARGDRRTGRIIYEAWKRGAKLDAWTEHFNKQAWEDAIGFCNFDRTFYTERKRDFEEILPWDIIDCFVSKKFLISEAKKAELAETTKDCRYGCVGCGMNSKTTCQMGGYYAK